VLGGSVTDLPAAGYQGRIGRYGPELAAAFLAVAGVREGQRALDVGCGSGALTEPLAELVGSANVAAVDPDASAVAACRARLPQVEIRVASAEELPFSDDRFDVVLAQLVMSLLSDADAGVGEERQREALRHETWRWRGSPTGPFRLTARAWYVRGRA
jgi:2-polyprenyl-3-methyl-5-hydroxy-6-metoxy-1,4-benzoquinol methylase